MAGRDVVDGDVVGRVVATVGAGVTRLVVDVVRSVVVLPRCDVVDRSVVNVPLVEPVARVVVVKRVLVEEVPVALPSAPKELVDDELAWSAAGLPTVTSSGWFEALSASEVELLGPESVAVVNVDPGTDDESEPAVVVVVVVVAVDSNAESAALEPGKLSPPSTLSKPGT